ncbi:anillin-like [Lutzomyia longipalpis]|uniref:anillin-like n=1 Tax=Lutzomyia longipalpis TaxID=7200 RepID=UPI002483D127|nr:anillin-like [Lutzomyia longipalpis]
MDPFTQRILDRAEQRSKHLGISNPTTKVPLGENSAETSLSSLSGSIKSPPVRKSIPVERKGSDGKNVLTYSANTSGGSDGDKFDNISVEINITTDTNVGVKCDVMAVDVDKDGNILKSNELLNESTTSVIRDASKSRLQRLGALYSDEQSISSPIHRTEGNFHERMSSVAAEPARPRNRLGKLAALAESINRWEDEKQPPPSTVGVQKENVPEVMKQTGAVPKRPQVVDTLPKEGTTKKTPTKQLKWDKSVMDALESQGFKRRESTKNLIYEYRETENRERENVLNETNKSSSLKKSKAAAEGNPSGSYVATIEANRNTEVKDSPKKLNVTRGLVTGRAAFFEASGAIPRTQKVTTKDPAEMSLKERMALFERNKGAAPVPKQLGATSAAAATATAAAQQAKPEEKQQQPQRPGIGTYNQVSKAETKATGGGIKNTVAALMSSGATISESAISQEVKRQRQQEMELLLNRFHQPQKSDSENEGVSMTDNNPPQPPPPPPMPSTSFGSGGKRRSDGENDHDVTPEEAKRPKKHGNRKSDRLYPSLSDLDSTESEQNCTTASVSDAAICEEDDNAMDSEETEEDGSSLFDGSISRAVMNSIRSAETSRIFSETKDVSSDDDEMDEYLNAALEISSGSSRRNTPKSGGTPRKGSVSSNSFSYKKNSPGKHLRFETPQTPKKSPRKQMNDDEGVVTLVHTVSIYRKQQTTKPSPSKVVRRVEVEESETETSAGEGSESSHTESQEMHKVQEKISRLQDEVRKQQQIIAQTSQVVNLCAATIEFSGSTEAVEGERHLLVATHRRQAALHEIQSLQVERTLRPRGSPQDKGRLTVNEITLPLTKDYIRKLAANTISGHHLVCLLKYNETVLATKTVLTLPGLMAVKFTDVLQMNDVYADFKVTLEIYGMVAERDILPHEIKYHIATRKQGGKILTPKGRKAESRLVMPPTQSPAGPSAVRSPSLVQLGFVIFALKDTQRTAWTLNGTCKDSPLNGTVQMKVSCQLAVSVNHWGFLTMFDDVSGLGNWYRRWCRLHGHTLSYWTYPDDEKKKAPIGSIDLYACCSEKVAPAPRDVCQRMNTLLLELKRPSRDSDKESLIIVKRGNNTIVRYLLSTDTKEERDDWCNNFNKALSLLRSWGPPSTD